MFYLSCNIVCLGVSDAFNLFKKGESSELPRYGAQQSYIPGQKQEQQTECCAILRRPAAAPDVAAAGL